MAGFLRPFGGSSRGNGAVDRSSGPDSGESTSSHPTLQPPPTGSVLALAATTAAADVSGLAAIGNSVAVRLATNRRRGAEAAVDADAGDVEAGWEQVGALGFVRDPPIETESGSSTGGANVRTAPDGNAELITFLPFGTRVMVQRRDPRDNGWSAIRVQDPESDANGTTGYLFSPLVWLNPPDPDSRLYAVQPGDGLQAVVEQHPPYQGYVRTGDDARSLVMAVYVANAADERTDQNIRLNEEKLAAAEDSGGFLDFFDDYRSTLRPIFQSIELIGADPSEGRKIWLPGVSYIDGLKAAGIIPSRAGWKNAAIAVAKGIGGFTVGLVEGFVKSIVDVFVGIYELIKSVIGLVIDLVTGAALANAKELVDTIRSMSVDELKELGKGLVEALAGLVIGAIDDFVAAWNHPSPYERWRFRGKIVGYILAEVLMLIFTGAIANGAKWLGKLGKVGGKLAGIFRKIAGKIDDLRPRRKPDVDVPDRQLGSRKGRELPLAITSAAAIAETHDEADSPVTVLLASLLPLKAKFPWIRRFRAFRSQPGHYRIALIASEHTVDRDYTPGSDDEDPELIRLRRIDELIDEFAADPPTRTFKRWKDGLLGEGLSADDVAEIVYQGSIKRDRGNPWGDDWTRYLQEISGTRKPDGHHGHHLVEKRGGGEYGDANRKILRDAGIHPVLGRENLTWAPFRRRNVHGRRLQGELNARLQPVKGDRDGIVRVLQEWAAGLPYD